jgi:hypothetical protein
VTVAWRVGVVAALLAAETACSNNQTAPSSQRVVLTGAVRAAGSMAPIQDVRVQVVDGPNAGLETMTNGAGSYTLPDLAPGVLTLLFTNSSYIDLRRTEVVRSDLTLEVTLERGPLPGFTLSGLVATQWGDPINDVGVEAVHDGRVAGGGTTNRSGRYSIPTLPAQVYLVRAIKFGYRTPQHTLALSGDAGLDIVMDRVRVAITGAVDEIAPCMGTIDGARVEVADGPDAGVSVTASASGYRLENINWGSFKLRASKPGYVSSEVTMNVDAPGSGSPQAPSTVRQDFRLQRTTGC